MTPKDERGDDPSGQTYERERVDGRERGDSASEEVSAQLKDCGDTNNAHGELEDRFRKQYPRYADQKVNHFANEIHLCGSFLTIPEPVLVDLGLRGLVIGPRGAPPDNHPAGLSTFQVV